MSEIKIGNKVYDFPNQGEKNWGDKLKNVVISAINYFSEKILDMVTIKSDQVIEGEKVFQKIPHVILGDEKKKFPFLHSGQIQERDKFSEEKFNELNSKVLHLESLISNYEMNGRDLLYHTLGIKHGQGLSELMKNDLGDFLSGTNNQNSAKSLFFSKFFLGNDTNDFSVRKALETITKMTDQLSPIGIIVPFHMLDSQGLAYWEDYDLDSHEEQEPVLVDFKQKVLMGGPWAPCDGDFFLPPKYFGRNENDELHQTPNLKGAFLGGAETDEDHGKLTGINSEYLSLSHIPDHNHFVPNHLFLQVHWRKANLVSISSGSKRTPVVTYFGNTDSGLTNGDTHPWDSGAEVDYHDKSTLAISEINLSSGINGISKGDPQKKVSKKPRHLNVNFFMRVQ